MTGAGGLSLREAVHRCGQGLTVRDATRLRRLCPAAAPDPEQEVDSGVAGQPVDQVSTVDHASTVDEPTAGDHT